MEPIATSYNQQRKEWIRRHFLDVWIRTITIGVFVLFQLKALFSYFTIYNGISLVVGIFSLFALVKIHLHSQKDTSVLVFGGRDYSKMTMVWAISSLLCLFLGNQFLPYDAYLLLTMLALCLGTYQHPHLFLFDVEKQMVYRIGFLFLFPWMSRKISFQHLKELKIMKTNHQNQHGHARGYTYDLIIQEHAMEFEVDEDPVFWDQELASLSQKIQVPMTSNLSSCMKHF